MSGKQIGATRVSKWRLDVGTRHPPTLVMIETMQRAIPMRLHPALTLRARMGAWPIWILSDAGQLELFTAFADQKLICIGIVDKRFFRWIPSQSSTHLAGDIR